MTPYLTNNSLIKKFSGCAKTWERSYFVESREFQIFFTPRLYSDKRFWECIGLENGWNQAIERALSQSTVLCRTEGEWRAFKLGDVTEITAENGYLWVLVGSQLYPLGSRQSQSREIEQLSDNILKSNLTFDHTIPLSCILKSKDWPAIRFLSNLIWDQAKKVSGEPNPKIGKWTKNSRGKRHPPKEWLGAKKLKKPVLDALGEISCKEILDSLSEEITEVFSSSTELMDRSANCSRGSRSCYSEICILKQQSCK